MKKRLLSAALALAMVLTLLPMSVFAADYAIPPDEGKTTVTYAPKDDVNKGVNAGDWYWSEKSGNTTVYHKIATGVVASSSGSGRWYSSLDAMLKTDGTTYTSTTITLLSGGTITTLNQNLTIDVNGQNLNILDIGDGVTSLTINNSRYNALVSSGRGNVSINAIANRNRSGLTLRISNTEVSGLNISSRANTITLDNVYVTSGITLDGKTDTVNNQGVVTSTTYATQRVTMTGGSLSGGLTITNGDSSTVSLQDTIGGSAISLTGNGGSVTIGGSSNVGNITVQSRQNGEFKAAAVPSVIVNGGKVGTIARGGDTSTTAGVITIGQANSAVRSVIVDSISTWNGTVTINQATVTNSTTVGNGTLTINGPVTMGDISLANTGDKAAYNKVALSVTGSNSSIGDISFNGAKINSASTISIPNDRTNEFGTLSLLDYAGKGIKGGSFLTTPDVAKEMLWFDDTLHFTRLNGSRYYYYGKTELSTAIADLKTGDRLDVLQPQKDAANNTGNPSTATFMNGNLQVAILNYRFNTSVLLPDKINGTPVTSWTGVTGNGGDTADTYYVNKETSLYADKKNVTFNLQSTVGGVTKLTNATIESSENKDVKVTVSSNQINLSGAVSTIYGGGDATILVKFYTDMLASGDAAPDGAVGYVSFEVPVIYNPTTRTGAFGNLGYVANLPSGVVVKDTSITVGSNVYTLNVSGLGVPASNIEVDETSRGKTIQVNFSGSGWTDGLKKEVESFFAEFDWTNSTAIRQAVNEALKSVNNNTTVNGYITAAQRAAWTLWNSTSPDAGQLTSTGYDKVYLVPYLNVTVSQYLSGGTLTFTAVPYYRIEVRGGENGSYKFPDDATHPDRAYIAKTGATLGSLTSDLVGVPVGAVLKFDTSKMPTALQGANMHQDGTYVYLDPTSSGSYTVTHSGNTGLGTISLNNNPYSVRLDTNVLPVKTSYYTSLQAAVDDTKARPQGSMDEITIESNYTGTQTISLTGEARTIKIKSIGNTNVVAGASGTVVTTVQTGHEYTVQLLRNTAAAGQNIVIANVTGGSAGVSANPATVGQTVTVTLTPATGYVSNGVTVRTNSNNAAVTVRGSGNSYTFTMPSDSVTVTPSFTTVGNAVINVASATNGSATTSATSARGGSTVTVYTVPRSGYQTTGVTVSSNVGSVSAVRTGTNQYQFTVPTNATTVTVTPNFAVDTGLPFTDVDGSNYYLPYVQFVYKYKIMSGMTTTSFGGGYNLRRGDLVLMLYRLSNSPTVNNSNAFTDVKSTDYYNDAITWAVNNGIASGRSKTIFDPTGSITRQDLATMLYNYNKYRGGSTGSLNNLSGFSDRGYVSNYAVTPMQWAVGNGIITGTTPTSLTPGGTASRYQVATMLTRYCQNFLNMT